MTVSTIQRLTQAALIAAAMSLLAACGSEEETAATDAQPTGDPRVLAARASTMVLDGKDIPLRRVTCASVGGETPITIEVRFERGEQTARMTLSAHESTPFDLQFYSDITDIPDYVGGRDALADISMKPTGARGSAQVRHDTASATLELDLVCPDR